MLHLLSGYKLEYQIQDRWYDAITLRVAAPTALVLNPLISISDYTFESTPLLVKTRNEYRIYTTSNGKLITKFFRVYQSGDFDADDIVQIELFKIPELSSQLPEKVLPSFDLRWYQRFRRNLYRSIDEVGIYQRLDPISSHVELILVNETNRNQLQIDLSEGRIEGVFPLLRKYVGMDLKVVPPTKYELNSGDVVEKVKSNFKEAYLALLTQLYP